MFVMIAALAMAQPVPGDPDAFPALPERPEREEPMQADDAAPELSSRLERCLSVMRTNPQQALAASEKWLTEVAGADAAEAGHCKGMALAQLGRFNEARGAFAAATDAVEAGDNAYRARLGGMAGNAALAAGHTEEALTLFGAARGEALAAVGR